jgi:H+-transporting ATPase
MMAPEKPAGPGEARATVAKTAKDTLRALGSNPQAGLSGAASVVLTHEGLACIVDLVKSGRSIYQRVLTWIMAKVSRTLFQTGFVVIPFLITGQFLISALAMVLPLFVTDFVKIAIATDRVRPSPTPETWNIGPLIRLSAILGLLMLVEALGLLAIAWHGFGFSADDGRLPTFAFRFARERRAGCTTIQPLSYVRFLSDVCGLDTR